MTSNVQSRTRTGMQSCLMFVSIVLLAGFCFGQGASSPSPSVGRPTTHVLTDWSEFHRHNMTRFNPYEKFLIVNNVGNLGLNWSYIFGNASCGPTPSPAVVNGVLYMGDCDRTFYAFDTHTGKNLWAAGISGGVGASPAIANGIVYIGSWKGSIYALNARTGRELWSYPTNSLVDTSPVVSNGVVYVASSETGASTYALDASTGVLLWSYSIGYTFWSSPTVANGVVYFGAEDGM
jgi:outer membrane protein assembly factor BamB